MATRYPIAVIGTGPIGLAASAHLLEQRQDFVVLEAGASCGASIRDWGHVRLFSPWKYLVDEAAARLLRSTGWVAPAPDELPTGAEFVERYLAHLAARPGLAERIRYRHRVESVSRLGFDKMKSAGRDEAPFVLVVRGPEGKVEHLLARAVIDASGTYLSPNPLGGSGLPAEGELSSRARVTYGIPSILGRDRARFAGKRALVVGSGHSAFNVLLELAELASSAPSTRVEWAIRRENVGQLYGGGEGDALPARGDLGIRLRNAVESGRVHLHLGFRIQGLTAAGSCVRVAAEDGRSIEVDEVVAATGFRPNLSMTRELRLALDPAVEAPTALASLIDPNLHSCGTVPPHGALELAHPEKDFFTVGMKSYGRAPTFLMLTGYEQVRSVVCQLTGDLEGARAVKLTLPETGVCSVDGGSRGCCPADSSAPTASCA